ncbi:MAG: leucyl/phenylalanyl-tRNA--protein transferase [Chloroflexota bacterium]
MSSLHPQLLISAYCQGVFPMAHDDGDIYWYDPDPRAILPLNNLHISRSLQRTLKKEKFIIKRNTAFRTVMEACAESMPGREKTWINDEILAAYTELHQLGFAHSVEVWEEDELVGGLYGVAIRGLFAGESMFSRQTNASKIALVHLVQHLNTQNFELLDIQFMTEHLSKFGAVEIPAQEYKQRLLLALQVSATFA